MKQFCFAQPVLTEVFEGFMGAFKPIYILIYYLILISERVFMATALFATTTTDHASTVIFKWPFSLKISRVVKLWS